MWECRKCSKPVFFAERKQSLGFDWHPNCLRCEECGKRLNPGQHAEHRGVPFCHHPCYGALFGPQLFGHGTRNECHTSFGKIENRDGQIKRSHLESRLKAYNSLYEGKPGELKCREVNGRFILEGVLRIYWGVKHTIHLKEEDDSRMIATRRLISTPNRINGPYYSDSDDEVDSLVWRDESPNRLDKDNFSGNKTGGPKRPETLSTAAFLETNGKLKLTPISDDSSTFSPTDDRISSNILVLSSTSEDLSEEISSLTPATSRESLKPLIEPDSESPSLELSNSSSNVLTGGNLAPNDSCSEGCDVTLLCYSDTLEEKNSFDTGTLTSSIASESLTSEYDAPVAGSSFPESKPLLWSSSTEYASTKEQIDESENSEDPSTPYSDCSDPSSCSNSSEPRTPIYDDHDELSTSTNHHQSSPFTAKIHPKRHSEIEFTVVDHEGNPLANTLPSTSLYHASSNGHQSSSSSSYYSVDSHLDTKEDSDFPIAARSSRNGSTAIRRRPGRRMDKSRLKRRCSINGHYYLRETSSFTPPYGSPCSIWITSKTTAEEVLNMLLEKYKVEMSTFNFALFIVKDSGELRRIREDESPLVARVMLGPHEDVAKVFIMDAQRTQEVSHEVAQFLNLSLAECRAILAKYEQEEANQVKTIKKKYEEMKFSILRRLGDLEVD